MCATGKLSGGPWHPLCDSPEHTNCVHHLSSGQSCLCITDRGWVWKALNVKSLSAARNVSNIWFSTGWDSYTFLAVIADLSNAVISALVFRSLSAVAKYVCRASSAVPWKAYLSRSIDRAKSLSITPACIQTWTNKRTMCSIVELCADSPTVKRIASYLEGIAFSQGAHVHFLLCSWARPLGCKNLWYCGASRPEQNRLTKDIQYQAQSSPKQFAFFGLFACSCQWRLYTMSLWLPLLLRRPKARRLVGSKM